MTPLRPPSPVRLRRFFSPHSHMQHRRPCGSHSPVQLRTLPSPHSHVRLRRLLLRQSVSSASSTHAGLHHHRRPLLLQDLQPVRLLLHLLQCPSALFLLLQYLQALSLSLR